MEVPQGQRMDRVIDTVVLQRQIPISQMVQKTVGGLDVCPESLISFGLIAAENGPVQITWAAEAIS